MNKEEKWRTWQAYIRVLPYLEMDADDSLYCNISYRGHMLYRCTKRLFRLSLMGVSFGGESPFTAIEVRRNPMQYHAPRIKFENDDTQARLYYDSVASRKERTAAFWEAVEGVTEDVSEWAWESFTDAWRSLRLKQACIDFRTWLGAKAWLNPKFQTVLVHAVPTREERFQAQRFSFKQILSGALGGRMKWAKWALRTKVETGLLGRLWKGIRHARA